MTRLRLSSDSSMSIAYTTRAGSGCDSSWTSVSMVERSAPRSLTSVDLHDARLEAAAEAPEVSRARAQRHHDPERGDRQADQLSCHQVKPATA